MRRVRNIYFVSGGSGVVVRVQKFGGTTLRSGGKRGVVALRSRIVVLVHVAGKV